jgi:hypothetical protein
VIKKTATDLDLPEEKVRIIIEKYWKDIYQKIVNGMDDDKTTLFLRNIGLFTISRYKLNNFIKKKIAKIRGMGSSTKYSDQIKEEFIGKQRKKLAKSLIYRNIVAREYAEKFGNI